MDDDVVYVSNYMSATSDIFDVVEVILDFAESKAKVFVQTKDVSKVAFNDQKDSIANLVVVYANIILVPFGMDN